MTDHQAECIDLAHGGDAVVRLSGGKRVFVAGVLPGEEVQITEPVWVRGAWRANLLKVHQPSVDRRTPECELAGRCGGLRLDACERGAPTSAQKVHS